MRSELIQNYGCNGIDCLFGAFAKNDTHIGPIGCKTL
jgi:hypothetical protein